MRSETRGGVNEISTSSNGLPGDRRGKAARMNATLRARARA